MRWLMVLSVFALGCQDDRCTKICKRVAACKEDSQKSSERVLGEKQPPPNRRCMDRCKNKPDEFATCEEIRRTCDELRGCMGADFDF